MSSTERGGSDGSCPWRASPGSGHSRSPREEARISRSSALTVAWARSPSRVSGTTLPRSASVRRRNRAASSRVRPCVPRRVNRTASPVQADGLQQRLDPPDRDGEAAVGVRGDRDLIRRHERSTRCRPRPQLGVADAGTAASGLRRELGQQLVAALDLVGSEPEMVGGHPRQEAGGVVGERFALGPGGQVGPVHPASRARRAGRPGLRRAGAAGTCGSTTHGSPRRPCG